MKKLILEYENRQEYEYDEDLRKKGLALENFDQALRAELKYGDPDVMLKEYKQKMKAEHDNYWPNDKFKFTASGLMMFILEDVRDRLNAEIDE